MRYLLILFFALVSPLLFAKDVVYDTYHNAHYQYSIDYPKNILMPQEADPDGAGLTLVSKNGDAILSLRAYANALNQSLEEAYNAACREELDQEPTHTVTYKVMKLNWFVVSGYREGGRVYYKKTILNNRTFKTFIFLYDANKKAVYEPITKHLAASFKG
jgi:hypothetical protein